MNRNNPLLNEETQSISLLPSSTKTRRPSFRRLALLVATSFLANMTGGVLLAGSYLINVVETSCPRWSASSTVYGESVLILVVGVVGLAHAYGVRRFGPTKYALVGVVLAAASLALSGGMISACNERSPHVRFLTEVVYVLSFAFLGVALGFVYFSSIECLLAAFPRRPGFASGVCSLGYGVGGVVYGQFFLALEHLYRRDVIDVPSIFYSAGILTVLMASVSIPFVRRPVHSPEPSKASKASDNPKKGIARWVIKRPKFWLIYWARTVVLLPGWGITARLKDILIAAWHHNENPPIELLSGLVMGFYIGGRLLWLLICDRVGGKNLWVLTTGIQIVSLGFLPWFMYHTGSWGCYASIGALCAFMLAFSAPKATVAAFIHDIFKLAHLVTLIIGYLSPGAGIGGLVGPLTAEWFFKRFGNFEYFFYTSCGLLTSGLFILTCI